MMYNAQGQKTGIIEFPGSIRVKQQYLLVKLQTNYTIIADKAIKSLDFKSKHPSPSNYNKTR